MSLRTKIRGFSAWVNFRLKSYSEGLLNNVVMDLMTGTNMKELIESMTGREFKKLQSFDGLTQDQKITRVEWILQELKSCKLVPDDIYVDTRMFAMRSADHIFKLLWRLICHDIWFVWERAEFLQHSDPQVLCEVPFKWIPEPPPEKKKKKVKTTKSLLSGFGSASVVREEIPDNEPDPLEGYDPFPHSQYMKSFKVKTPKDRSRYPSPENCILELVISHLKMTQEGQRITCSSIDDLVDHRVLCALMNSFFPNAFTAEVLLNDRYSINLILRMAEKMFYSSSPFDSEDLVEGESTSICAYFCSFFMLAYKFRQSKAIAERMDSLKMLLKENMREFDRLSKLDMKSDNLRHQEELRRSMENTRLEMSKIEERFDVPYCFKWVDHVKEVIKQTQTDVRKKMKERFDTILTPRSISISEMCLAMVINLILTGGGGFYLAVFKESVSETRRIVLRVKKTGEFIDDFNNKSQESVRRILRLPERDMVDIIPANYPKFEIFLESPSKNKTLKQGATFLYQVFPPNTIPWQRIFLKAAKDDELDIIEKMAAFFKDQPSFINCKEPATGNTALHLACKLGHYDVVEQLLESCAYIDSRNSWKQTPLMVALEGGQKYVAHLLIEWGCDVHAVAHNNRNALSYCRSEEVKTLVREEYEHYSDIVPRIMDGDIELLHTCVLNHTSEVKMFSNLRSRCINGSTLLHTAAYFGAVQVILDLLSLRVDINLQDYKGAAPLHRAKDVQTMEILLDFGATVNAEDAEGNTPLHVKCYGESDKPSEIPCIEYLIECGADVTARNHRGLMPIHCCAMQGRSDVISMLLQGDEEGKIQTALEEEGKSPPSVVYLALANDCIECAEWLLKVGFQFKEDEPDLLLQRIVSEQIKLKHRAETARFLLEHGANPNPHYVGGNSALHFAATLTGGTDVLEVLLLYGGDVDMPNDEQCTPLFFATQTNNQFAASVLIDQGANVRCKNMQGLTAFDFIVDFEEWIESGYFTDEIRARLKAFSLKHARDLVRAISKKVKVSPFGLPGTGLQHSNVLHTAQSRRVDRTKSAVSTGSRMFNATPMSFMTVQSDYSHTKPMSPVKQHAYIML